MCVYAGDTADKLSACLDSLTAQTRMPDEIVIVKDGPLTAPLDEVIARTESRYPALLRIHALETNAGLIEALNQGLRHCRGELLFRMDADDIAGPNRLERQCAFMQAHPDVGVLGCAMQEFTGDPALPEREKSMPESHEAIRRRLPWRNPVNHPTVCLRRQVVPASGYPALRYLEDYFLWARLMVQGVRFHNLPDALLLYRFDDATLARRSGWLNFRNEVALRWWMYRHGLVGLPAFAAIVLIQAVLRFSPLGVQRLMWNVTRRRVHRGW